MKTKIKISILLAATVLIFTGCNSTRYLTEWYIKNKLEQHVLGEVSTIKTYSIYQGVSIGLKNTKAYIEFTGCKYDGNKFLVVGADKYFLLRDHFTGNASILKEPSYVVLDLSQCIAIVSNYTKLMEKIKAESPIPSEEVYYDFTPSNDLFISFRKAMGISGTSTIDVWVENEKYTITTKRFIKQMKKFINY